jgi:hypothetical protein
VVRAPRSNADRECRRRSLLPSPKTKFRLLLARRPGLKGDYAFLQWRAIEASLQAVGIDTDAVSVGEPFYPGVQWWRVDHPNTVRMRPLRDALQEMSWYYSVLDVVGPGLRRRAAEEPARLAKALAVLEPALELLDSSQGAYHHPGDDLALAAEGPIRPALRELIEKLQARLDDCKAERKKISRRSSENRSKVHREFWRELAQLWEGIGATPPRHKHVLLQNFLRACSAPTFRTATMKGELAAFTKEFFALPRRKQLGVTRSSLRNFDT